jgi:hypothetical protein
MTSVADPNSSSAIASVTGPIRPKKIYADTEIRKLPPRVPALLKLLKVRSG